jgi:hypothetical protein
MIANQEFQNQPKMFWAYVRTLSQQLGYTVRGKGQIKIPTLSEIKTALETLGLDASRLVAHDNSATDLGSELLRYFNYRAQILNDNVRSQLMKVAEAEKLYKKLCKQNIHKCPLPINKQSGEKAKPSYFTGIINMLIANSIGGAECNYSPMALTTVTRNRVAVRTLSRRVDGAFPSVVNPIAVWEIKEYYYTTTFGSRIADGVYETLVDGMELEELRDKEGIEVRHYLMVDAFETWWEMGRSYLCRLVDMLHMRYVDEILFGREVVDRIPVIAKEWVQLRAMSKVHKA